MYIYMITWQMAERIQLKIGRYDLQVRESKGEKMFEELINSVP